MSPQDSEDPDGRAGEESLEHLRELLDVPGRGRVDELEERLAHLRVRARDVSEVLPDALLMQRPDDERIAHALEPYLGRALESSVQRNLGAIRDALVPVLGPLVRKYVRSALASMLETLNRALEHSFTLRGLRWRWQAFRTGMSFSEVVLLNSLKYRVEQVFLIHRESGVPLQRAAHPDVAVSDPDMVSGMLTAIREFVRDSFDAGEGEEVSSLQIGDLQIVAQAGEHAVLAAIVRGMPPEGLSRRLARTLESIHRERRADLEDFQGDDTPFRATRPQLEDHLVRELHQHRRLPAATALLAIAALSGVAALVWLLSTSYSERNEWRRAFELLQAEPGIVVTSWGREEGRWVAAGLRDPDARAPAAVLANLPVDVTRARFELRGYVSLEDELIRRRALRVLSPPAGVTLAVEAAVLRASGRAPSDWIERARREAREVIGVRGVDLDDLAPPDGR